MQAENFACNSSANSAAADQFVAHRHMGQCATAGGQTLKGRQGCAANYAEEEKWAAVRGDGSALKWPTCSAYHLGSDRAESAATEQVPRASGGGHQTVVEKSRLSDRAG